MVPFISRMKGEFDRTRCLLRSIPSRLSKCHQWKIPCRNDGLSCTIFLCLFIGEIQRFIDCSHIVFDTCSPIFQVTNFLSHPSTKVLIRLLLLCCNYLPPQTCKCLQTFSAPLNPSIKCIHCCVCFAKFVAFTCNCLASASKRFWLI